MTRLSFSISLFAATGSITAVMKAHPLTIGYTPKHSTARCIAVSLLVALLLGALSRAHGQTAGKAAVAPAGVYALLSVDGKPVPCTLNHEGTAMDVRSGTFTISTNGQCSSLMVVSVGDRKNLRVERQATYKLKNAELTMTWKGAGLTKGRVAGQTFTMTNEGMAYVYRK